MHQTRPDPWQVVEVEGYTCNHLTVGNSPYTVVVNPGSASPVHSTYRMPNSFNVGEPNFVHASVQDAYSNAVFLEDALNQLHVFAQLLLLLLIFVGGQPW